MPAEAWGLAVRPNIQDGEGARAAVDAQEAHLRFHGAAVDPDGPDHLRLPTSVIVMVPPIVIFTLLHRYFCIGGIGGALGGH